MHLCCHSRIALNPKFATVVDFQFDTRYPQYLGRKFLTIKVFDKDKFSKDDFIGRVILTSISHSR